MKLIDQNQEGATIEFTTAELRLVFSVLGEVRDGPNAFDDDDWDMLIGLPRALEVRLLDELQPVLDHANALEA